MQYIEKKSFEKVFFKSEHFQYKNFTGLDCEPKSKTI